MRCFVCAQGGSAGQREILVFAQETDDPADFGLQRREHLVGYLVISWRSSQVCHASRTWGESQIVSHMASSSSRRM